jgi:hypothetical protein
VTPPAVGLGTLNRLAAMPAQDQPVLSVYLDFDHAHPASCLTQFDALLGALTRQPEHTDSERVRMSLSSPLALAHGTRSIGLFAAGEGSACAMVPLPVAVEAMVVVEAIPWLEPVAGMLTFENWGAAVLGRRSVRLLRGGQSGLVEFATSPPVLRRGVQPRVSSSTAPQAVGELVLEQVEQVARMLARAHARRPFERLVLVAPRALWLPLEHALPEDLRKRMIGALELQHSLVGGELSAALIDLLRHDQDGRGLCCKHATATMSPGGRPAVVNQTPARLVRLLPHASACESPEQATRPLVSKV